LSSEYPDSVHKNGAGNGNLTSKWNIED